MFLRRFLDVASWRTPIPHQGPRRRFQVCSEIHRGVVVQRLSRVKPKRALPTWEPSVLRRWHRVVRLARVSLLTQVHRNENQKTVKFVSATLYNTIQYIIAIRINIYLFYTTVFVFDVTLI